MTKKDYELIANQVLMVRQLFAGTSIASESWEVLTGLSYQLAKALKEENDKFDKDKFLTACGVK